ncbi:MAG: hypothetical protein Q4B54_09260 [Coriobacteriales bacterium]|nr:hypothetical protein [Coriobacteriales bacterium]
MREPSFSDAFEVLCLQAADKGRGPILFGDCLPRVRETLRPFFVSPAFPSVYLEFPLLGDPFLDVTLLYASLDPSTRIASDAASGTEALLDWFSTADLKGTGTCMGFELDTKQEPVPAAAVHFQPRKHTDLVQPFFDALGEPERAQTYFALERRLPESWHPDFFGLFRGRPDSPLRVCGYITEAERKACAKDLPHLKFILQRAGFSAYNDEMLSQMQELMQTSETTLDYQFDIYPDETLGSTFAFDVKFKTETPDAVRKSFCGGSASRIMQLFEQWGLADKRWELIPQAAFARAVPVERDNGEVAPYSFTLMPGWAKLRWCDGVMQPAKFYFYGTAGILADEDEEQD